MHKIAGYVGKLFTKGFAGSSFDSRTLDSKTFNSQFNVRGIRLCAPTRNIVNSESILMKRAIHLGTGKMQEPSQGRSPPEQTHCFVPDAKALGLGFRTWKKN